MDPATAGTVGFLIRLVFLIAATLLALRVAGLTPETLAVGGAITAVVFGLAAQQTLGNLIAGMVLISARPFKVGDRVRLQAGGLAGQVEGVVASLGLLYTTFAQGEDSIMVPNNVVLTAAVVPLREPASVDLRARLRPDVTPSDVQTLLDEAIAYAGPRRAAHLARGGRRATRSSCASGHAAAPTTTAPAWPTRCWPRSARSRATASRRGRRRRGRGRRGLADDSAAARRPRVSAQTLVALAV